MKFLSKIKKKIQRIFFRKSGVLSTIGRLYLKKKLALKDNELGLISWYQSGETYLLCSMIESFKKDNDLDCKIVLIGTKNYHRQIYQMFSDKISRYCQIDPYVAECLQDKRLIKSGEFYFACDLEMWRRSGFETPVSHFKLLQQCNFIREKPFLEAPNIEQIFFNNAQDKFRELELIRGKTVLLSTEAVSVKFLPKTFWELLCREIDKLGYKIFMNIMDQENYVNGTKTCFLSFPESLVFADLCGHVIAIRSGFCEVISEADVSFQVIFPTKKDLQSVSLQEIIKPEKKLIEYVGEDLTSEQLVEKILTDLKNLN